MPEYMTFIGIKDGKKYAAVARSVEEAFTLFGKVIGIDGDVDMDEWYLVPPLQPGQAALLSGGA